ncbi:SGNH/GDSL hydrolase family protein [Desulfobotulus sp. H1]|uniref:SGNH/GDSL hydrolase family protein n=1 Tax=Desulfobotulus pelophilus TaxID=2823377 RepID=A0ABT3NB35_9BACT|nr:SGNH/GDSL hydrolase family protein [Desulfobotulus pelophilus]MCW7754635.1 SGNH/GDSL hydrolase family protein [Desulfobotulus pelophilus]
MEEKKGLRVGFVGDSILYGWAVAPEAACWRVFQELAGMNVVCDGDVNPLALPGGTLPDLVTRTPRLVARYGPQLVFVCAGANHYDGDGTLSWPYGMTEAELFRLFYRLFADLTHAGCKVVWLGLPPFEACGTDQEIPRNLSQRIAGFCADQIWDSCYVTDCMMRDPSWNAGGGRFYDNLAMDIHPNTAGQVCIAECCAAWLRQQNGLSW